MNPALSKSNRRRLVIINYIALLLSLVFLIWGDLSEWATMPSVAALIAILVVAVTFVPVYGRTGLWKFVHTKSDRLDERELLVTYESLRHSYTIFSIVALVAIQIAALTDLINDTTGQIIFWSLFYLAHTLPASVIAWTLENPTSEIVADP